MTVQPKTARGRMNLEWCNMWLGGMGVWWMPELYDNATFWHEGHLR